MGMCAYYYSLENGIISNNSGTARNFSTNTPIFFFNKNKKHVTVVTFLTTPVPKVEGPNSQAVPVVPIMNVR